MVKLTTTQGIPVVFYFKNAKDCDKFLKVFENCFCNVPWRTPEIILDSTLISDDDSQNNRIFRIQTWLLERSKLWKMQDN